MPNKSKRIPYTIIAMTVAALLVGSFLVYATTADFTAEEKYDDVSIPYSTEYVDDNELELGTEEVRQVGVEGKRRDYYKLVNKVDFGDNLGEELLARSKEITHSEIIEHPISEIIHRGTKRWQYMICSDGGYQYYTDDDFTRLGLGFTHASPDFCAQKGKGAMVGLADAPPTQNQNSNNSSNYSTYTSPYRYTPSYNYSYTPSYSYTAPPDSTAKYESPSLEQWTPSGSTGTSVESGTPDKWCGYVGNEYICR